MYYKYKLIFYINTLMSTTVFMGDIQAGVVRNRIVAGASDRCQ